MTGRAPRLQTGIILNVCWPETTCTKTWGEVFTGPWDSYHWITNIRGRHQKEERVRARTVAAGHTSLQYGGQYSQYLPGDHQSLHDTEQYKYIWTLLPLDSKPFFFWTPIVLNT